MRSPLTWILDKYNYRDPLAWAQHVVPERTDQGVDYYAMKGSPIRAMGNCRITRSTTKSGWPGGGCVQYVLTGPGSHQGEEIYVAEFVIPAVKAGQWIKKGQVIGRFSKDWRDKVGIETGYIKRGTHQPCATNSSGVQTAAGKAFARWLRQLGRTTLQDPGPGSTLSPCGSTVK